MSDQSGKRTTKIKVGEFLVEEFSKDPEKIITMSELKEAAISLGVSPERLDRLLLIEFAGAITTDGNGNYSLSKEWGAEGFLDAVNDQRRRVKLPLLEFSKPSLKER